MNNDKHGIWTDSEKDQLDPSKDKMTNKERLEAVDRKYTWIRITIGTHTKLKKLGAKDETYDQIIQRIIDPHLEWVNKKGVKE
jgi:hypothetical protein